MLFNDVFILYLWQPELPDAKLLDTSMPGRHPDILI